MNVWYTGGIPRPACFLTLLLQVAGLGGVKLAVVLPSRQVCRGRGSIRAGDTRGCLEICFSAQPQFANRTATTSTQHPDAPASHAAYRLMSRRCSVWMRAASARRKTPPARSCVVAKERTVFRQGPHGWDAQIY